MLLLVIFALALRLIHANSGSSDEQEGNEVTTSSGRIQSSKRLASSESAQCHICGLCFKNLGVHMNAHNPEKPFSCSQCDKQFTLAITLRRHQRIHSGEKLCNCVECGKQFTTATTLRRHQRTHTDEKTFNCTECGKQFAHAHRLHSHQRTHTGEKPFNCLECGKQFARADNLKYHQCTHTGLKPFGCTECGKQYSRAYSLQIHQRIHAEVKPFLCTACGKQFSRSDHLNIHQHRHSGENPFECLKCGKRFARAHSLRRHHQTKHAGFDNSTAKESPGHVQTVLENSVDNLCLTRLENLTASNYPYVVQATPENLDGRPPLLQIQNLAVKKNPSLLHPALQIPMGGISPVEREISVTMEYPFLLQSVVKNSVDSALLTQMNNPTGQESPFFFHMENAMYHPGVSENRVESSPFSHMSLFPLPNPMHNPSLAQKKKGAVLENLIGIPSLIRADTNNVPMAPVDNPLFVQMQDHILTNAEGNTPDVHLPSDNSDTVSGSIGLECPVCFERFGEREALKDHLLNSSCSLYPLDWQPYLESGDNDDLAK